MAQISRIALLLGVALFPAPVLAADYDPPIYVEDAPEYVPVEVGSGWYLRGDIAYIAKGKIGDAVFRNFDAETSSYTGYSSFPNQDLKTDFSWGGGFGYRYNEWVRGDLTVEGFRADFGASSFGSAPCFDPATSPAFGGTACRSENGAEVSAIGVMANGYVDLGTFVGFTPYLGAGIGYSYVSWSGLSNDLYCVEDIAGCPPPGGIVSSALHPGSKDWRLTYALMAGFAYDVSRNMKLDVGYKYRHIDGGDMFTWDAGNAALGASGAQGRDGGFDTHEIKVGLRYELW